MQQTLRPTRRSQEGFKIKHFKVRNCAHTNKCTHKRCMNWLIANPRWKCTSWNISYHGKHWKMQQKRAFTSVQNHAPSMNNIFLEIFYLTISIQLSCSLSIHFYFIFLAFFFLHISCFLGKSSAGSLMIIIFFIFRILGQRRGIHVPPGLKLDSENTS